MKNIIFLLVFIFGIKSANAEDFFMCSNSGMDFFPSTKEISLNSMFIIQGYATSQETINSFKNRIIYLESKNGEIIELHLQEILKGQMKLTQAIFRPVSELKPNTTYFLKYSKQTKNEEREMMQYNREKKKREKIYWKTTDKKSMSPLNPNLNIEFNNTKVNIYGCGPSANTIFNVNNKSEVEIWYKTEVINLKANTKNTFYVKEWKGKLNIGHGMCSGAFTFNRKGNYKVRFSPMNTDGKSLKTTEWKTFESPFLNNKNAFGY